mmetsp:Transcript_26877/g.32574  ORF Transcript_26877/g.32574 Transcript_26877/m.32574 type:complete len:248 (+) Transcript_26877:3022-3765(+)
MVPPRHHRTTSHHRHTLNVRVRTHISFPNARSDEERHSHHEPPFVSSTHPHRLILVTTTTPRIPNSVHEAARHTLPRRIVPGRRLRHYYARSSQRNRHSTTHRRNRHGHLLSAVVLRKELAVTTTTTTGEILTRCDLFPRSRPIRNCRPYGSPDDDNNHRRRRSRVRGVVGRRPSVINRVVAITLKTFGRIERRIRREEDRKSRRRDDNRYWWQCCGRHRSHVSRRTGALRYWGVFVATRKKRMVTV